MSLKDAVNEAWNNAMEGGYKDWLLTSEPIDIAIDMMDCDCDVEAFAHGDTPVVESLVRVLQNKAKEDF